ncbi:SGNH/GDSL hydrolase family protein [Kallotenue papyrolyticum]|uniref:SGNH/GDSL hydrolase family protein n=1 Tax=Kallotenue papyrolyticum TaxID=1325125 RepID=UPI0004785D9E|nr:SGNH/GDSL hydrolase family protein [Kallotenue papyrolyticum]
MIFSTGQTILFIGDSITDAGRQHAPPYGDGYVSLIQALLQARYPELGLRVINRGVSGDTTRELLARWERDALAEQPDWLSLLIGINDVWRSFGANPHAAVPLPEYEANLRSLLGSARERGARLILMTPYMIEPERSVPMRRQMDWYGAVVRRLAAAMEAVLVDTQAAFDAVLRHTPPEAWATDQIHPNRAGHAVIALAWLRAVGFSV